MIVFIASILTASCNTMEGMGKDIKRGGEKIEESAQEYK